MPKKKAASKAKPKPKKAVRVGHGVLCSKCYIKMEQQGNLLDGSWDWLCLKCDTRHSGQARSAVELNDDLQNDDLFDRVEMA